MRRTRSAALPAPWDLETQPIFRAFSDATAAYRRTNFVASTVADKYRSTSESSVSWKWPLLGLGPALVWKRAHASYSGGHYRCRSLRSAALAAVVAQGHR